MNFDLKSPCNNCPFRKVGAIELRPGRLGEIVTTLLASDRNWFICHKTAHRGDPARESQCVGSMVYLLKVGSPSVSMRVAAATRLLDYDVLRGLFSEIVEPSTSIMRKRWRL